MTDDLHAVRRDKLAALRAAGDAYPNAFRRDHLAAQLVGAYGGKTREELAAAGVTAAVAGRIVLRRRMGKATFFTLQDMSGRLQVYFNDATLGAETAQAAQEWDLGDIIGVHGEVFKTKTDELTLRASAMHLLVKSLHPLPDKYHGLSDTAMRYRQRYVSLIANESERSVFARRAATVRYLRDFFHQRGYMEVETPILQPLPGGAAAKPFTTHCNALGGEFYLRIAQELYLKRLIVGGFERVFELNRNFRNEGISPRHNPEFTMLEFNAAYEQCETYINLTEELLHGLVVAVCGSEEITYQGEVISFKRPFARVSPLTAIRQACPQFSDAQLQQRDFLLQQLAEAEGERAAAAANLSLGELQLLLFEKCAEHTLQQPTFLVDYPAAASPLAKRSPHNPHLAERFELFVAGRELVNGFSELNDPQAQAEIFRAQVEKKDAGDEEAMYYDADYITALEYGLPPNAGGGIGIDRLVMLLTDQPSIRDVILFPQLRAAEPPSYS